MSTTGKQLSYIEKDNFLKSTVAFKKWIATAAPRSRFVYHYGLHLYDDMNSQYNKKLAWIYAVEGMVYLFQQRDPIAPQYFFYIAQKASRKIPKLNPNKTKDDVNVREYA
jgi:hypothetical protein